MHIFISGAQKRPQGLGILKDRLNLEYMAGVDANSRHRALHILRAGPDLSGEYTCSVSTLQSEDIRTKKMLVLGKLETKYFFLQQIIVGSTKLNKD